ncbi:lytic murein transglycosylase [Thalassobaculum sp.]|uniref:lytic murein transglycosylase n=1 Tax=Thalassobaculum sp. TaxID=2022740 RepID=UPI0032ED96D9
MLRSFVDRRLTGLLAAAILLTVAGLSEPAAAASQSFEQWLAGVRTEARARGVSDRIFDAAFDGVQPIPRVIELDRNQPEFRLKFDEYLGKVVTAGRIATARRLMAEHAALLDEVSAKYKVQKRFIVALWGIESDFGRITGGFPVVAALATLAFDGRRGAFFRKELLLALDILQQGHIAPADMKGSWAGAMGQNQFMPSSFHAFAVDHNGDGHKDIWGSLPDVFASIARYLARSGWNDDITWGREVELPKGFDGKLVGLETKKPLSAWQSLGVRKADGGDLPGRDLRAAVVEVTQRNAGPRHFVAYENFEVILKWNRSTYFAIAVGTLADALDAR